MAAGRVGGKRALVLICAGIVSGLSSARRAHRFPFFFSGARFGAARTLGLEQIAWNGSPTNSYRHDSRFTLMVSDSPREENAIYCIYFAVSRLSYDRM